jgi:hypothetical protein
MIAIEDQIRRYAIDVAGPAAGAPPADLDVVGHPRHRGRWVLVAALVVFIAGLTWVATRPTELGDRPSVDTVPTTPTTAVPADAISRPESVQPCEDAGPVGVQLTGSAGDGLCIAAQWSEGGTAAAPEMVLMSTLYADGDPLGGGSIQKCASAPFNGVAGAGMSVEPDRIVIWVQVPEETATGRVNGDGPTFVAFDLPGVEGSRFIVARAPDQSWTYAIRLFDASGQPVPDASGNDPCMGRPATRPMGS